MRYDHQIKNACARRQKRDHLQLLVLLFSLRDNFFSRQTTIIFFPHSSVKMKRDTYTIGHSGRVAHLASDCAKKLSMNKNLAKKGITAYRNA